MLSRHIFWHYLLIFILALSFRFALLGGPALNDSEAVWALQAHQLAAGGHPLLGAQTAYISLTASLFYIFDSTDFLARTVPALAGAVLVWLPYAFRRRLKPTPGLILSIFLAIDPGLVALSRQAGSPILTLTFALFAWAFWDDYRPRLAGIFVGMALLSGPALWPGMLGLGLGAGIYDAWLSPRPKRSLEETGLPPASNKGAWKFTLAYALGVIVVIGSLFLLAPGGLTAWLSGLPEYIRGWGQPSGVPIWRLLLALFTYEPLALALALVGILRAWLQGGKRTRWLSLWLLNALLLALLYPARQVSDLAWTLIPLWGLAALELVRHLQPPQDERLEIGGITALIAVVMGFAWLNLLAIARLGGPSQEISARLGLLGGAILLIVISLLLVGMGWSAATAKYGGLYGLLVILTIYTIGAAWGTSGLRTPNGIELWDAAHRPVQARLLSQTVDEASEWSTGDDQAQPVMLVGISSPSLEWHLRWHAPKSVTILDPAATPPLVITPQSVALKQPAIYRGQDFGWNRMVVWENMNIYNWLRWLTLRDVPTQTESLLLWVRDDLFVDRSQ